MDDDTLEVKALNPAEDYPIYRLVHTDGSRKEHGRELKNLFHRRPDLRPEGYRPSKKGHGGCAALIQMANAPSMVELHPEGQEGEQDRHPKLERAFPLDEEAVSRLLAALEENEDLPLEQRVLVSVMAQRIEREIPGLRVITASAEHASSGAMELLAIALAAEFVADMARRRHSKVFPFLEVLTDSQSLIDKRGQVQTKGLEVAKETERFTWKRILEAERKVRMRWIKIPASEDMHGLADALARNTMFEGMLDMELKHLGPNRKPPPSPEERAKAAERKRIRRRRRRQQGRRRRAREIGMVSSIREEIPLRPLTEFGMELAGGPNQEPDPPMPAFDLGSKEAKGSAKELGI